MDLLNCTKLQNQFLWFTLL